MRIRSPHLILFAAFLAVVSTSFFVTNTLLQKSVSQFPDPYQGQSPNIVQDSFVLSFGNYGNGQDSKKGQGWLQQVANCTWIDKRGDLELNDIPRRVKNLKLIVEAAGSTSSSQPEQEINVIANSSLIGKLKFSTQKNQLVSTINVPGPVMRRYPGQLRLSFIEQKPKANNTFGLGSASPSICLRTISLVENTKT